MKPGILFWIVGVFSLLWNGFGLVDLVMTSTNNEDYLAQYTAEQIAYWQGLPGWRLAIWVVGVTTALLGSLFFLARRRLAVPLFAVAPVLIVIGFIHDGMLGGYDIMGSVGLIGTAVLLAVQIFFWWFARRLARRGVLS